MPDCGKFEWWKGVKTHCPGDGFRRCWRELPSILYRKVRRRTQATVVLCPNISPGSWIHPDPLKTTDLPTDPVRYSLATGVIVSSSRNPFGSFANVPLYPGAPTTLLAGCADGRIFTVANGWGLSSQPWDLMWRPAMVSLMSPLEMAHAFTDVLQRVVADNEWCGLRSLHFLPYSVPLPANDKVVNMSTWVKSLVKRWRRIRRRRFPGASSELMIPTPLGRESKWWPRLRLSLADGDLRGCIRLVSPRCPSPSELRDFVGFAGEAPGAPEPSGFPCPPDGSGFGSGHREEMRKAVFVLVPDRRSLDSLRHKFKDLIYDQLCGLK